MSSRSFFVFRGSLIILACGGVPGFVRLGSAHGLFQGQIAVAESHRALPGAQRASAELFNSPRIDQLIKNGKLMLSLDDAITLALENNLDLAIARYNLDIADTDILRTKSGAAARGVATGIVSGTPGGGVNGFGTGASGASAGGTSSAAGGAGTGTGGLVTSTTGVGPTVPSFDPFLSGTLADRARDHPAVQYDKHRRRQPDAEHRDGEFRL